MIQLSEPSSLPLSVLERQALIAALYVVKDNWWLTEVEERVLRRLELQANGEIDLTADPLAA